MLKSEQIVDYITRNGIRNISSPNLHKLMIELINCSDEKRALMISYTVTLHWWPFSIQKAADFILEDHYRSWAICFSKIEGWWPYSDQTTSKQIIESNDDSSQAIRWAIADGWFSEYEMEISFE